VERWRWNKPRQKKTLNTRTVMILQKRKQVLSNSENKGRKTNIDHTEGQDSLPILKKIFFMHLSTNCFKKSRRR
jgi:hypothetical protein